MNPPRAARLLLVGVVVLSFLVSAAAGLAAAGAPRQTAAQVLAGLRLPPDWLEATPVNWDTNQPWKEARLEIRRLLALDEAHVRQGVKLTWLYARKGDIGDGHELPMYLFMSGNYDWALKEYPGHLRAQEGKGPTHAYLCYASCLAHFGDFEAALAILNKALADLPPKPWRIASQANIENQLGDLYGRMGQTDQARAHYAEATRLYGLSDQPYGRHLLPRKAAQVQAKLRLMAMGSLASAQLKDGVHRGSAIGYADKAEIVVTLEIRNGRFARLDVQHQEKIELGATKILPQRILEKQSLQVDGVTGATVTCQGIVEATYRALLNAGLR